MGVRVLVDTPDPQWVLDLHKRLGDHLLMLRATPFVRAAATGPKRLSRRKMARFMVLMGNAVIRFFPNWLDVLQERAKMARDISQGIRAKRMRKKLMQLFELLERFARLNRIQERHHWKWWRDWAEAYGVQPGDFQSTVRTGATDRLTQHLDRVVMFGSLLDAVIALNLVIESLSGALSQIVHKGIGSSLSEKQARWLVEHAEGDPDHGADAWELTKLLVLAAGKSFNLTAVQAVLDDTGMRFTAAMRSSYPEAKSRKGKKQRTRDTVRSSSRVRVA
jgi:pyrroloquinoline quinone (PQQ) biosynthesis protein C